MFLQLCYLCLLCLYFKTTRITGTERSGVSAVDVLVSHFEDMKMITDFLKTERDKAELKTALEVYVRV